MDRVVNFLHDRFAHLASIILVGGLWADIFSHLYATVATLVPSMYYGLLIWDKIRNRRGR